MLVLWLIWCDGHFEAILSVFRKALYMGAIKYYLQHNLTLGCLCDPILTSSRDLIPWPHRHSYLCRCSCGRAGGNQGYSGRCVRWPCSRTPRGHRCTCSSYTCPSLVRRRMKTMMIIINIIIMRMAVMIMMMTKEERNNEDRKWFIIITIIFVIIIISIWFFYANNTLISYFSFWLVENLSICDNIYDTQTVFSTKIGVFNIHISPWKLLSSMNSKQVNIYWWSRLIHMSSSRSTCLILWSEFPRGCMVGWA